MVLPIDEESYSYRFYKNLNEDVKLKSNEYGEWDIDFDFENDDWVNVTGFDSLSNACVIAIMTRFIELGFMPLYDEFGCRVHELIKENKSNSMRYRIEVFITETLENMRRVRRVNWVEVKDNPDNRYYNYKVNFNISCTIDEDTDEELRDLRTVERSFLI